MTVVFVALADPQAENPPAEIQAQLAKGRAVTLIEKSGKPKHARTLVGDSYTGTSLSRDDQFTVFTWTTCMVELLPDTGRDSYTVSAQIRHEKAATPGSVGLYVAQRSMEFGDKAKCLSSVVLSYNDIRSVADIVNLKKLNLPLPKGNQARLFGNLLCQADGQTVIDMSLSGTSVLHEPARPLGMNIGVWRTLEITVTPEKVEASWDGMPFDALPAQAITEQASKGLERLRERRPELPWLREIEPKFQSRGGVGIHMHNGVASFRDVRVTPL